MFLDTANADKVKEFINYKWVKGVTTNPTLIKNESGKNRYEIIEELYSITRGKKFFVQVQGESFKELEEDAEYLINEFKGNLALKIQANEEGYNLISKIKDDNPDQEILATVIFSLEQAFFSGLAGADWIAPYINRMMNASINPFEMIHNIKKLYSQHDIKTKIMGASFKNQSQIMNAFLSGADENTIPTNLLKEMLNNKLAKESLDVFAQHAKEVDKR